MFRYIQQNSVRTLKTSLAVWFGLLSTSGLGGVTLSRDSKSAVCSTLGHIETFLHFAAKPSSTESHEVGMDLFIH